MTWLSNTYIHGPKVVACICFLLLYSSLLSQPYNIGHPLYDGFSPNDYKGGTQNWRTDLSDDGRIFFANNDGLLVFDGYAWKLYPLPNRTIVRSVDYHNDTIYVGGQDELGFFTENDIGGLEYTSLWHLVPDTFDISDVWDIHSGKNGISFRTSRNVFVRQKEMFEVLSPSEGATFLEVREDALLFNDRREGVQAYEDRSRVGIDLSLEPSWIIVSVIPHEGGWLVFTESHGVYISSSNGSVAQWGTNAQDYLTRNKVTAAITLSEGGFAIGTRQGGLLLLDRQGKTQYLINKKNGLQDNSITDIVEDDAKNIWITTFFGINRIRLNTGLFTFYPDGEFEGAVYDALLWKDRWWFATINGLYWLEYEEYTDPFDRSKVELVKGTEGQVWGLDIIDDNLYIAHHRGAFHIDENLSLRSLNVPDGVWRFIKCKDDQLCIGGYNGVYTLPYPIDNQPRAKELSGFRESSRIMEIDINGHLWVSHPYRGVFRLRLDKEARVEEIKTYAASSGFVCELGNYVFSIDRTPMVVNNCGVFRYDFAQDRFITDDRIMADIDSTDNVRRIFEQESGLWYISEQQTCFLPKILESSETNASSVCISHIGKEYVGGFENLYIINQSSLLLCATKGVRMYHEGKTLKSDTLEVYLKTFRVNGSINVDLDDLSDIVLAPSPSSVLLEFGTRGHINKDLQGYEYRINNNSVWSVTKQPMIALNKLSAASYQVEIRSKVKGGKVSPIFRLKFKVREKWYKTRIVITIITACIIGIFFLSWRYQKRTYERDTSLLINEKVKTEEQLVEEKEIRLKNELAHKNRELTSATLHLMQKQQTLSTVRRKIEELENQILNANAKKEVKRLYAIFDSNDRLEDDWDRFAQLFDRVHVDFLRRLKQKHPHLRPKDRKLCAFLRMNLATKEIAPLLNISIRGVEISRYRLRKKLGMDTSENLTDVIASI